MVLIYEAIHAALLPVRLYDLPNAIGAYVAHIGRRNEQKRPKQTACFQAQLQALALVAPPPHPPPQAA